MTTIPPDSLPPEVTAKLARYFAGVERKIGGLSDELRRERERRERESQRVTSLESWREDVSLELREVRGELKQARAEVREMTGAVMGLKATLETVVADNREQNTVIREAREALSKLQISNKALWAMFLSGGAVAGGVAKALSAIFS